MADKLNKNSICVITELLVGMVGIVLMWRIQALWLSVVLGAFFASLFDCNRPSFLSILTSLSSTVRGTIMGAQGASNHLGRALGAMIGGLVLALGGYNYLGVVCLAFCIASAILLPDLQFRSLDQAICLPI